MWRFVLLGLLLLAQGCAEMSCMVPTNPGQCANRLTTGGGGGSWDPFPEPPAPEPPPPIPCGPDDPADGCIAADLAARPGEGPLERRCETGLDEACRRLASGAVADVLELVCRRDARRCGWAAENAWRNGQRERAEQAGRRGCASGDPRACRVLGQLDAEVAP